MSLYTTYSSLNEDEICEVNRKLQEEFSRSLIELQAFILHLEWMGELPWAEMNGRLNEAESMMANLLVKLQQQQLGANLQLGITLQYISTSLQNTYGSKPSELACVFSKIYHFMKNLFEELYQPSTGSPTTDDYIEDVDQFYEELKECDLIVQQNNKLIEEVQQIYERKDNLEIQNQGINLQQLVTNLFINHQKAEKFQNCISKVISNWKFRQQRVQEGWPVPLSLDDIQPACQKLAEVLYAGYVQSKKVVEMLKQFQMSSEDRHRMEDLASKARAMLSSFLTSCFIVEKHPPQVTLINKIFKVQLKWLAGGNLVLSSAPPTVTLRFHFNESIKDEDVIENNKGFSCYQDDGTSIIKFDNLKIKTPRNRKIGANTMNVTDQKSCLLFKTELSIDSEKFDIEVISLPMVVILNANQAIKSEATIFWDNAFAEKNRRPFVVPSKVPMDQFLKAVNYRWTKFNNRSLSQDHLDYLAAKLIPDKSKEELHSCHVTIDLFLKTNMRERGFSLWQWFCEITKLVKEHMLSEWGDGKIYGFVDYTMSEQLLECYPAGTFLLRFSESVLGGVTITYKSSTSEASHMGIWKRADLKKMSLSDSIRDVHQFTFLYLGPVANCAMKDEAFGLYYSNSEEVVDPRYPKKGILVRQIDDGSSSSREPSTASSFVLSRSNLTSLSSDNPFSPSPPMDSDPFLAEALAFYGEQQMDEDPLEEFFPAAAVALW